MRGLPDLDVVAQLRRSAVLLVAALGVVLSRLERDCPLGSRKRLALHVQALFCGRERVPCSRQGGALFLQPAEGRLTVAQVRLEDGRRIGQGLDDARVLGAAGRVPRDRVDQLLARRTGPAIGAAHGLLEPVPQGAFVAVEIRQLLVTHGGRRTEELLGWDAGQVGKSALDLGRVGDRLVADPQLDPALGAGEDLVERAGRAIVVHEVDAHGRRGFRRCAPTAEPLDVLAGRGHLAEEAVFDGPLDGRLAGLVGASDDGQAGRELEVEILVALDVPEAQALEAHQTTVTVAGSVRRLRPRRRDSRSSSAPSMSPRLLGSDDASLQIADEGADDGVGRRQHAVGLSRHRSAPYPDLEEARCQLALDLLLLDLELVRQDAHDAHIEHEIRVGRCPELLDEGDLAGEVSGVDVEVLEARAPDDVRGDGDVLAALALLEIHAQDLSGAVLVHGDRLGCARVGPGRLTLDALAERVPVAEGEVMEPTSGDLGVGEEDIIGLDDTAHAERAVDEADPPPGALIVARREAVERAAGHPLRGRHAPIDDEVQTWEDDVRPLRCQHHDHVAASLLASQRGEVVDSVDRGRVVDIVRARDDHGMDPSPGQATELGGRALDRASRLLIGVEKVAGDEDDVDLLGQREVDGSAERLELSLSLGGRRLAEVVMSSAEVDVGHVQQSRHLGGSDLRASGSAMADVASEEPPRCPRPRAEAPLPLCHLARHVWRPSRTNASRMAANLARRPLDCQPAGAIGTLW